jgi:hypothetical protein
MLPIFGKSKKGKRRNSIGIALTPNRYTELVIVKLPGFE